MKVIKASMRDREVVDQQLPGKNGLSRTMCTEMQSFIKMVLKVIILECIIVVSELQH